MKIHKDTFPHGYTLCGLGDKIVQELEKTFDEKLVTCRNCLLKIKRAKLDNISTSGS